MALNRPFFYAQTRRTLFDGSLSGRQVEGLEAILDEWENNHARKDDRWLAYMLATTHHETDRKMWPIEEYGKGRGRKYGQPDSQTGKAYYGRRFVQLTWKYNYERWEADLAWISSEGRSARSNSPSRPRSCSPE